MCKNIRRIVTQHGIELFVPCGHCDACLQDKADKRSLRIQNNYPDDGHTCMVMVTLTYDDRYIPYVRKSDMELALKCRSMTRNQIDAFIDYDDEFSNIISLPVYRDYDQRWRRCSTKEYYKSPGRLREVRSNRCYRCIDIPFSYGSYKVIGSIDCEIPSHFSLRSIKGLRSDSDKVAVAFYPDAQKFFKRLRTNLKRDYDLSIPISYFSCSEYGSRYSRSHFHMLLFFDKRYYEQVKQSTYKSWTYDYRLPKRCDFKTAVHPASYVATYVNCAGNVPALFLNSKLKPKCSYSFGFGLGKKYLSLSEVFSSFNRGDFEIHSSYLQNQRTVNVTTVLPSYVINRYAPKCKGYSRLNADALYNIAIQPERLSIYAKNLGYVEDDLHKNVIMLRNKKQFWLDHGFNEHDFALFYSRSWSLRYAKILHNLHDKFNETCYPYVYRYYNLSDYIGVLGNFVYPRHTSQLMFSNYYVPKKLFAYETNPNLFVDVQVKHRKSFLKYHYYKKVKHVNAFAFNDTT